MKIIIGQNGLGKTKYLAKLFNDSDAKVKFIITNTKDNTPLNNLKHSASNIWSKLEDFCNKIILKNTKLDLKDYFDETLSTEDISISSKYLKSYKIPDTKNIKVFETNKHIINLTKNLPIKLLKMNKKLKSEEFGTGNIQFQVIAIILNVIKQYANKILKESKEKPEIYIDEPEKHLHPQLIKEMSIMLQELNEYVDITIVSHSPLLASYVWSEDDKVIKFVEKDKAEEVKIDNKNLIKYNTSYRESLFNCLMHEKVIVVEDNNIFKVVEYYLYEKRIFKFAIIVANMKTKLPSLINDLIALIKIDKDNILAIWDKDDIDQIIPGTNKKHGEVNDSISNYKTKVYMCINNIEEEIGLEQNKKDKFDKNKYNELREKILETDLIKVLKKFFNIQNT